MDRDIGVGRGGRFNRRCEGFRIAVSACQRVHCPVSQCRIAGHGFGVLGSVMRWQLVMVLRCNGRWSELAFHKHRWRAGCEWSAGHRGQLRALDGPGRLPMSIRSLARCGH